MGGEFGGVKESLRKRYLSCECMYGGGGVAGDVWRREEGADVTAVIFALKVQWRDQCSLLAMYGRVCVCVCENGPDGY